MQGLPFEQWQGVESLGLLDCEPHGSLGVVLAAQQERWVAVRLCGVPRSLCVRRNRREGADYIAWRTWMRGTSVPFVHILHGIGHVVKHPITPRLGSTQGGGAVAARLAAQRAASDSHRPLPPRSYRASAGPAPSPHTILALCAH